jgi:hypothetical protein
MLPDKHLVEYLDIIGKDADRNEYMTVGTCIRARLDQQVPSNFRFVLLRYVKAYSTRI